MICMVTLKSGRHNRLIFYHLNIGQENEGLLLLRARISIIFCRRLNGYKNDICSEDNMQSLLKIKHEDITYPSLTNLFSEKILIEALSCY